ncbi:MAG: hypothetical protein ABIK43_00560 [candidate division WOR-3 bacterium]
MAHAYTPGLKVSEHAVVRRSRRLPLPGDILVGLGQKVRGDDIVARTALPGGVQTVNVAGILGVPPEDVPQLMLKKVGDHVEKDEVIALSKGLLGLFKTVVKSPVSGSIENVSSVTGQVILREPAQPVQVDAYIDGEVVEIIPREGVVVETSASLIQGIFGVGGEVRGALRRIANDSAEIVSADKIDDTCVGKVLIAGSLVTYEAIEKALSMKARAIIGGGIEDSTLRRFLGYDIGVAITGSENTGLTVIVTEGFGEMRIAKRTFELLCSLEGRIASVNGATQIRAGVIRPEVIVPQLNEKPEAATRGAESGLSIGMPVRIIRQPNFGRIGRVVALPVELAEIETEARVRILEVELEDGTRVSLPRANIEIIEN